MYVSLRQLTHDELGKLVKGEIPASLPNQISEGALPPPFVLSRAAAKITEGESELWWLPFLIIHGEKIVGGCAFKGAPSGGRIEILYGVSREHRKQGVAAAAIRELVREAFRRGAHEVLAEIEPNNIGSVKAVQKCAFKTIGSRVADDGASVLQFLISDGA